MIHKFSEIKYRLKLHNACRGILRLKVAGMLEKQGAGIGSLLLNREDLMEQIRNLNFNRTTYDALNSPVIRKLEERLKENPGDTTAQAQLLAEVQRVNPSVSSYKDAVDTIATYRKDYNSNADLNRKLREVMEQLDRIGGRGGGGGSRSGPTRIRVRLSDGSVSDIPIDEYNAHPEAYELANPAPADKPDERMEQLKATANKSSSRIINTPEGMILYDHANGTTTPLSDDEARLISAYIMARPAPDPATLKSYKDKKGNTHTMSPDGVETVTDSSGKILSRSAYDPFSGTPKPTDTDDTGTESTGPKSFEEYMAANNWTRNPTSGEWELRGGAKGKGKVTDKLSELEFRDNLRRWNEMEDPSKFHMLYSKDYAKGELLKDETDLKNQRRAYNSELTTNQNDYNTANNATYSGSTTLRNALSNKIGRDEDGAIISGISGADADTFLGRFAADNAEKWHWRGGGAGLGAVGGGFLADYLRNKGYGASSGINSLLKSFGKKDDLIDTKSMGSRIFDDAVGSLIGGAIGYGLGNLGMKGFGAHAKANRRIIDPHNRAVLNIKNRNTADKYHDMRYVDREGRAKYVIPRTTTTTTTTR